MNEMAKKQNSTSGAGGKAADSGGLLIGLLSALAVVALLEVALMLYIGARYSKNEKDQPSEDAAAVTAQVPQSQKDAEAPAQKSEETLATNAVEASTLPDEKPVENDNSELYKITYQSSNVYRDTLGDVSCYALVEIENTSGKNLYLKDAVFDFEDSAGSLMATYSLMISRDPDIIAPGEKGYFYCNAVTLNGEIDENTNYVFQPHLSVEPSRNEIVRFEISDLSMVESNLGAPVNVIGRVTNNTDEDESLVWVSFVFYGADGRPLGACGTNLTDLKAGETKSFDGDAVYLIDAGFGLSDIADYKVFACKTQYQF